MCIPFPCGPLSVCWVCIPSPCAFPPPAKSACPLRVARFRLLNLHFLSVCLASACTRLQSHIIRGHNLNADASSSPEGRRIRTRMLRIIVVITIMIMKMVMLLTIATGTGFISMRSIIVPCRFKQCSMFPCEHACFSPRARRAWFLMSVLVPRSPPVICDECLSSCAHRVLFCMSVLVPALTACDLWWVS